VFLPQQAQYALSVLRQHGQPSAKNWLNPTLDDSQPVALEQRSIAALFQLIFHSLKQATELHDEITSRALAHRYPLATSWLRGAIQRVNESITTTIS
jgi:hypothetical protein